ncbi:SDR family NAD(P)-dependent oxidoreductase [Streptomyces sp. NPDC058220]|uniref:SDR family NAD(P)-dependent oxidoreductase n=1 Tax=Streptomyces sp. NPDC058220 TaxID=3346387 RepID=UPI0036EA550C
MLDQLTEPAREVALVVGSDGPVSRIVCRRLAAEGVTTAVAGPSAQRTALYGKALADERIRALPYQVDPGEWDSIDQLVTDVVADLGRLDVLVNLTAATPRSDTAAEWSRVLNVNLAGAYRLGRAAARAMAGAGRPGRIVVLTPGERPDGEGGPAAGVSAAGVASLVADWARLVPSPRITVNAVTPEPAADPDSVASAILLLLRTDARSVTGQSVTVPGPDVLR